MKEIETIQKDIAQLKKDVAQIKRWLEEDYDASDHAAEIMGEARKTPRSEYVEFE